MLPSITSTTARRGKRTPPASAQMNTPFLTLQEDGNLVLYCGTTTQAIWATGTEDTVLVRCAVRTYLVFHDSSLLPEKS